MSRQLTRFLGIGVVSTVAHALLFLLLRGLLAPGAANALALATTAVANTAANRRLTSACAAATTCSSTTSRGWRCSRSLSG